MAMAERTASLPLALVEYTFRIAPDSSVVTATWRYILALPRNVPLSHAVGRE
jgi:hypothetical protein